MTHWFDTHIHIYIYIHTNIKAQGGGEGKGSKQGVEERGTGGEGCFCGGGCVVRVGVVAVGVLVVGREWWGGCRCRCR